MGYPRLNPWYLNYIPLFRAQLAHRPKHPPTYKWFPAKGRKFLKADMKINTFLKRFKTRTDRLFNKSNWRLFLELVRANFKVRENNSILGIFWSLIGPIALLIIMYFVFRLRFGQEIKAYPLYLLIGIITTTFFITATTYVIKIFFAYRDLVLNTTVPREVLVASELYIHVYKFVIELFLCLILSIFYGVFAWKSLLLLLPLLISYIALALGISLIISLIYCFARDIEHIWMLVTRLLFFATPIFYTLDSISALSRKIIYWLNPLTPFLISFQNILIGKGNINSFIYLHSLLLGMFFFILGYATFFVFENTAMERA